MSSGIATSSDTNWAVQPQKMSRAVKSQIKIEEGLYHHCSENKGADQLCGYCEADMPLCFRIYAKSQYKWGVKGSTLLEHDSVMMYRLCDNVLTFVLNNMQFQYEPHCEKTGLRGFRPGQTQARLYSHQRWLET